VAWSIAPAAAVAVAVAAAAGRLLHGQLAADNRGAKEYDNWSIPY